MRTQGGWKSQAKLMLAVCVLVAACSEPAQPSPSVQLTPAPSASSKSLATAAPAGMIAIPVKRAARVPADVPEHLSLTLGGVSGAQNCADIDTAPSGPDPSPREWASLAGTYIWCYCQLDEAPGSIVTATLTLADGTSTAVPSPVSLPSDQGVCAEFWHSFAIYPPRLPHTFTVELSGRTVVDVFEPLLGEFVFDSFEPNERARVIVYADFDDSGALMFVADERAWADEDGRLIIWSSGAPGETRQRTMALAVGQKTGCRMLDTSVPGSNALDCSGAKFGDNFIRSWTYESSAPVYNFWPACPGAPPSELHPGDRATVSGFDARRSVFSEASSRGAIIGEVPGFEVVEVLEGPGCVDGLVWWRVSWSGGKLTGWMVEREDADSANLMYER